MNDTEAGIVRRLPCSLNSGVIGRTVLENAQYAQMADRGYARRTPDGGFARTDAGHKDLIRFDREIAVRMRGLLHTLLAGNTPGPDDPDHYLSDLLRAGLAEIENDRPRLTADGEWIAQRSLEDHVALWQSRPNVPQIFRAIDAGRVSLDEAQALLAAERARRHPGLSGVLGGALRRLGRALLPPAGPSRVLPTTTRFD
ncbi:hypothetical protein CKO28_20450 [Rhodovibrio sodomensis]|uniref:Uncharacterized protein n=1 Tax=Rhodovibrio sodomensis TaxID=1088 RepID=A0ABS1DLN0_9PROT|nr:hypothetical protein [Rhodovibrio sodomensis]MBK1670398.1 hypothetical protein [Rhodovibrio sodomensis]